MDRSDTGRAVTRHLDLGCGHSPRNPYARGRFAVWQDQSDGQFQIYARDLSLTPRAAVALRWSAK